MPPPSLLLGPPKMYPLASSSATGNVTGDHHGDTSMDQSMVFHTNNLDNETTTYTTMDCLVSQSKNRSLTYLATGNPCLDFFLHVVPDTPPEGLTHRLEVAWNFDSLTTLKLICNLRGVRGTGKSDKEGFYTSALWLHQHHPKTLASNVRVFADFGYFKDLLEILYRLLEGPEVRKIVKEERRKRKRERRKSRFIKRNREMVEHESKGESESKKAMSVENMVKANEEKENARMLRKEREITRARKALERYTCDSDYRFFHDQIFDLFAELLKSDIEYLNSGKLDKISLASKWCPTIDSSYDKSTLICESIARRVFPRESYLEYEGIDEEAHYVYRVRDRLRKQVLVPLHKGLELPEVYMSSNKWDLLPYNRVASVAMKTYKRLFSKHNKERFEDYLEKVKNGEAKIAAGALLPHEIIASLKDGGGGEVAELQWRRMVEDVSKKGKLKNCIAICDVSGSMNGTLMEVCVALGLLISELSEDPWKGKVITFSEHPQLHMIKGDSLLSKTEFVKQMDWGNNTNFQKVFDQILQVAVNGKLSEDQMIKRVFVFSDMEFDMAKGWETDYEVIQGKYQEKGYTSVPEIVFWNLRDSRATPVAVRQNGVALVSGFSKNLLTLFLEGGGIVNPEEVMELAISREEYKKLVVFD